MNNKSFLAMKITRLELETNNLPIMQSFYAHQLGLPLRSYTYWSATFQVGWTELTFRQTDEPTEPYHFALNVPLYSLEQYSLWYDVPYLDAGSPGNRIAHFPTWKARASYFQDPDGNLVEFIERRDAGYAAPAAGYFQGISEIGLATDNVAAATAYLAEQFGLKPFAKSRPLADFNAVGDDYGLLILAQTNRPWLFTNLPARPGRWRAQCSDSFDRTYSLDSATLSSVSRKRGMAHRVAVEC